MNNDGYYTEENQKAEFFGGAIAAGCGLIVFVVIVGLIIYGVLAS